MKPEVEDEKTLRGEKAKVKVILQVTKPKTEMGCSEVV